MYSSSTRNDGPFIRWLRDHTTVVLLGSLLGGYLILVVARHMGYASFSNLAWGFALTFILPNIHRWREIGSFEPDEFIDALLRGAALGLPVVLLGVIFVVFFKYYPRPHFIWGDFLGVFIAAVIAWWATTLHFKRTTVVIMSTLSFWIASSIIESIGLRLTLKAPPLPVAIDATAPDTRIGLALSGGGFRAATVHAGALHALESAGVHPTNLATVSGGSIVGTYFAMGGTPDGFRALLEDRQFHLKRELFRFPGAIHLAAPAQVPFTNFELFPWTEYNRADLQMTMLKRLITGDARLSDVSPARHLMIVTTDLVDGQGLSATREGCLISPRSQAAHKSDNGTLPLKVTTARFVEDNAGSQSLAKFVVASGAFPIAFPPIPFELEGKTHQLADGGIIDNTGIGILLDADYLARNKKAPPHWKLDLIIASDGAQLFQPSDSPNLLRFVDIIHSVSTAGFAGSRAQLQRALPIVHMSPANFLGLAQTSAVKHKDVEEDLLRISGTTLQGFILDVNWDDIEATHYEYLLATLLNSSKARRQKELEQTRAVRNQMSETELASFEQTLNKAVLNAELKDCIATFLKTSTLEDQLNLATVDRLFRLGQYMVYLRWPDIAPHLESG